ncbi:hypothetical protein OK016_29890 [Vibrio chagasii]|nr:hypothetical protein [Vibrio chagasii]
MSQQLKSFKTFLDTTLFERSSKAKLTSAAQHYQPIVAGSVGSSETTDSNPVWGKETDVLSLRVNHTFLPQHWLLPRLPSFYQKYPFIRLDIQLVDWPSPTLVRMSISN